MAKLHQINGPQIGRDLFLTEPLMTVGRSEKNQFILNDIDISRRHAQIEAREGMFYLKDLGSVNGTFVNSQKINGAHCLRNGDEIKIGYTKFFFFFDNNFVPSEELLNRRQGIPLSKSLEKEEAIPSGTLFFSMEDLDFAKSAERQALDFIQDKKMGTGTEMFVPQAQAQAQVAVKAPTPADDLIAKYAILFKVSDVLIQPMNLTELLDKILALLVEIFPADRCFLFIIDQKNDELLLEAQHPKPSTSLANRFSLENVDLSYGLLKEVLKKRTPVLTQDAAFDQRFEASKSIHMSSIRSAMVTPLLFQDQILGVLQLDSRQLISAFMKEDLDLFVAVARQIAVAIHSKRLDEKYLQEKNYRDRLSRFHSPEVVEALFRQKEQGVLEVENKECTVLFSDVKGFTAMSERLPAMDIANLMNEYFTLMADIVFQFNGTLDKFIGDAVMAVFGAPIQREDDPKRAIRSAVLMQETIKKMNKNRPPETQFHVRIGINTGQCVAGLVGSPQRMEYTVLGDAVNTASRIESHTLPGKIYISHSTYLKIKDEFNTKILEPISVKNKSAPVKIYEILFEKES
jgi:adenylate cyclase